MFSTDAARLRAVDDLLAEARKRERVALEGVARAAGANRSRRSIKADVHQSPEHLPALDFTRRNPGADRPVAG
jgi:hypothetical protein